MKKIVIILLTVFAMPLLGQNNNDYKKELDELFLELPIFDGYKAIIDNKKGISFKEEFKYIPLPGLRNNQPASVVYFSEINNGTIVLKNAV